MGAPRGVAGYAILAFFCGLLAAGAAVASVVEDPEVVAAQAQAGQVIPGAFIVKFRADKVASTADGLARCARRPGPRASVGAVRSRAPRTV